MNLALLAAAALVVVVCAVHSIVGERVLLIPLSKRDDLIPSLAAAGLTALEACHSDHDAAAEAHYRQLAARYGLGITGGSDFHADGDHHAGTLGSVGLPSEDFAALRERRR